MSPTMRFLFKAPNRLYRWNLGWMLGKRMLQIQHKGRRSGLRRTTVLEVLEHSNGNPVLASGFGARSEWLLNITANPNVKVIWGRAKFDAVAVRVEGQEAEAVLTRYLRDHKASARNLQARLGVPLDDPKMGAQLVPLIRLVRS